MNDLPAEAKTRAEKDALGFKIFEVEKEMKSSKVVYAMTCDQAGTMMEVESAPGSTLISKGKA